VKVAQEQHSSEKCEKTSQKPQKFAYGFLVGTTEKAILKLIFKNAPKTNV
jgi:hypothetical protein